jgi:hypothetical protein
LAESLLFGSLVPGKNPVYRNAPAVSIREERQHEERMKKIEAIIKLFKLEDVKSSLVELGIQGSVLRIRTEETGEQAV